MAKEGKNMCNMYSERCAAILNDKTPLAVVLQDIVVSYLKGAVTLFVADLDDHCVREVNLQDFSMRILAGKARKKGHADGKGENALFDLPQPLAFDEASDAMFIGQATCIRRVTTDGVVSTFCGSPTKTGFCIGAAARFNEISGLLVLRQHLFVSECFNHCIRRIDLNDASSSELFAGSPVNSAIGKLKQPAGMAADETGAIFVADSEANCIWKITEAGEVSKLAGCGIAFHRDGTLQEAQFHAPIDVALVNGQLLVTDMSNHCIRSIDLEPPGRVTTLAGDPLQIGNQDGPLNKAFFHHPVGLTVDRSNGDVYVSTLRHSIRRIRNGIVSTVCEGDVSTPLGLALKY